MNIQQPAQLVSDSRRLGRPCCDTSWVWRWSCHRSRGRRWVRVWWAHSKAAGRTAASWGGRASGQWRGSWHSSERGEGTNTRRHSRTPRNLPEQWSSPAPHHNMHSLARDTDPCQPDVIIGLLWDRDPWPFESKNRGSAKLQDFVKRRRRWWWWVEKLCSPALTARNSRERASDILW